MQLAKIEKFICLVRVDPQPAGDAAYALQPDENESTQHLQYRNDLYNTLLLQLGNLPVFVTQLAKNFDRVLRKYGRRARELQARHRWTPESAKMVCVRSQKRQLGLTSMR